MSEPDNGQLFENSHARTERVYFEHTDFSGVVYHARYLDFLEHGRSDYVRMLGVHHSEMAAGVFGESLAFAVHHMDITFSGAARIDDVLTVETERGTLAGPKLSFNQRIKRGDETLLSALVTVVLVNPDGRPRRYPKALLEKLGV
ncbi:YbgC/FadM family acyl-CoA thioesterase [Pseudahrensia aquimaris]|uniref:YbgC/FadM family acyl-CoA thioesterase n=1 Tax=Pseudahrensia aquimaris TaxID=744461 RepID=A0ABW3FA21_9HYPH